jgi:hypothetical protein
VVYHTSSTQILIAVSWHNTHAINQAPFFSASWGWASNARNLLRPLILNTLNKMCIRLVSLYWYTVMHGQQNLNFIPD